jgi:hypothetical protein
MKGFLNECLHSLYHWTYYYYCDQGVVVVRTILFLMIGVPLSLCTLLVLNSFRRTDEQCCVGERLQEYGERYCELRLPFAQHHRHHLPRSFFCMASEMTPIGWSRLLPSLAKSQLEIRIRFPPAPIIGSDTINGECVFPDGLGTG